MFLVRKQCSLEQDLGELPSEKIQQMTLQWGVGDTL